MSEIDWRRWASGLVREMCKKEPEQAAALLDALLRERGYEKRWAVLHSHSRDQHDALELMSSQSAAEFASGYGGNAVEIYVPLQRESE